ncbi:MAG: hypothetical protein EHM72_04290, partial [Calditrichaeota bacterium]
MKKILFICGSLNQTTQLYQISQHFNDCDCYFTPYYMGDWRDILDDWALKYTVLGPQQRSRTLTFLTHMGCQIDWKSLSQHYDFVFTCSDIVIQKNIRHIPMFLVQEGMTDPEKIRYRLVKLGLLPRYAAGSSVTGLSDHYQLFFVASEGYKELFIRKGVRPEKLHVTGIPNFDDFEKYRQNNFPHHHYALAVTSNLRECGEFENRREFIQRAKHIADGRKLIFKLHPAEKIRRATAEIRRWAPEALIFSDGVTEHMVANCDLFITRQSSV